MRAISLFSGIGGLDFGFEAAGFETRVALELDRHCCRAIRLNRPGWAVIEDDVNAVPAADVLARAGLAPGEAEVLIGGPPCQPFSKSAYWVRGDTLRLDDPRAATLRGYLEVLRGARPRAFLLENVGGLAYEDKNEGLKFILDGVRRINAEAGTDYRVSWRVINTAGYGVPQIRERTFLVASRDGREFRFPEPTHGEAAGDDLFAAPAKERLRTAWDALGDLPEPGPEERGALEMGGHWRELLPSVPEGENYLWHTDRRGGLPLFGWRTRYWSFLLKLSKRLPSWTVQAQPGSAIGPFHWKNRRLTFRELGRLQTFPDGLVLDAGRTEMQRMLGNAVPSLVAEVLAREIRRQLLGAPVGGPLRLLPPRRHDVPPSEPVAEVAEKYLHLVGDHTAHPGTGKGRAALRRVAEREAAATQAVSAPA
jgi:DNA (cytosine-5)-methyltransferase 1